jgi:hypothetical protein
VECTRRQHFVLVVGGDGDEKLGVSVVHCGTQVVAIFEGEVVGVAVCGRVCVRMWLAMCHLSD